jgi:hypothetical protein
MTSRTSARWCGALEHDRLCWLIERDELAVCDRHERDRIAPRGHRVLGDSDHAVKLACQLEAVADREPQRAIDDHLAVRLREPPAPHERQRLPDVVRPSQPDEGDPEVAAAVRALDDLIRVRPRAPHERDRGGSLLDAGIEPRCLGERTARIALNDP